ncbi:MAG: CDP-2,3-bis-(O-geranylgeranyl)-sn-glycerol synthase [Candidatus Aenigmatarchaeota archaeon]|nr:MAG: CDP-2,3-bis-(O-geranylgeranyl)-sn-glycerol synthase [Candidatus Aenigmarchaeota archaeon]
MVFDIYTLVEAIWLILPAFAANGLAPLFRGKRPIDGGRMLVKNRIFGPGKTWEGLMGGTIVAVAIALVQQLAFPFLPWHISEVPLSIAPMTAQLGFMLGLGAMAGDLGGSFIKRRFRMKRGAPAPLLDQLDFLTGAMLFASLLVSIRTGWWILLLVITPVLHWIACIIGYLFKVKKTPY